MYLGAGLDLGFIGLLAVPCLIYFWFFRGKPAGDRLEHKRTAWILAIYAIAYFLSLFAIPILGASAAYWLVQFLIPLSILWICREPLSRVSFKWSHIFSNFRFVILAVILITPILLFSVRDSDQIISLFQTWKIIVYLPISILFMFFVAAFWEEFFFRGVFMSSLLELTNNPAASIFASALLFGSYHIPMRYLSARSQYHGDLVASIAATIDEQFVMGLVMGIVVYKSKNVWHGIWLHSALNGISYVYQLSLILKL